MAGCRRLGGDQWGGKPVQGWGGKWDGGYRLLENFGGGFVRRKMPEPATWPKGWPRCPRTAASPDCWMQTGGPAFRSFPRGCIWWCSPNGWTGFIPFGRFYHHSCIDGDMEIEIQPLIQPIVLEPVPATGQHPGPMIAAVGDGPVRFGPGVDAASGAAGFWNYKIIEKNH